MPPAKATDNASRLGRFLAVLHRFPVDRAAALGIPVHQARDHAEVLLGEARHLVDRIAPRLPSELRDRCAPFLDGTVPIPPTRTGPRCLIHGDLQAEHILLNADGEAHGVVDFGDAAVGEPVVDYVGLCAWQGWDFTRAALAASGLTWDEATAARIRFMARCLGLIGVGWAGWQDQNRLSVRLQFLYNAFGG
jgi:aminoglycoside phosphotransferase (APT) family kinase protein